MKIGTNIRYIRLVEIKSDSYIDICNLGNIDINSIIIMNNDIILKNFKLYNYLPNDIFYKLFTGSLNVCFEKKIYCVFLIEKKFVEQNEKLMSY